MRYILAFNGSSGKYYLRVDRKNKNIAWFVDKMSKATKFATVSLAKYWMAPPKEKYKVISVKV